MELYAVVFVLLALAGFKFRSYQAGKRKERLRTLETQVDSQDEARRIRDKLNHDADYAKWVRDQFSRDE